MRKRRKKIDKNRLDIDPSLIRTKWNYIEFAVATESSELIRGASRTPR